MRFVAVISACLRRIDYGDEGFPVLIGIPGYERARVVADPTCSFGAPVAPSNRGRGTPSDQGEGAKNGSAMVHG